MIKPVLIMIKVLLIMIKVLLIMIKLVLIIVIVVITGYPTIGSAVDAIKAGAFDFLPKPFTPDELRLVVKRAMGRRGLLLQSQRLRMERELMKRRFMTFVSHQVKSPLSAIRQYLEMMQRGGDSAAVQEKREDWLARCMRRTDDLLHLVDDWLTLSRVECADLVHRREHVDVAEVGREILKSYEPSAVEKEVSLVDRLAEEPLCVAGDPGCIGVLLDNLIVNAIKYNRPGGEVTLSGTSAHGEVVVDVTDTGPGIPEKYHPFLFDEFFRVQEAGEPQRVSGTGLGLPICRKIVTEMGGTIEVHSVVGEGSTFRIRLPAFAESRLQP